MQLFKLILRSVYFEWQNEILKGQTILFSVQLEISLSTSIIKDSPSLDSP